VGTAPTVGFQLAASSAVVAEPGVEEAVRAAVIDALAARRALGPEPLFLRVTRADWRPGRRTGETVIYDATLVVEFSTGARTRTVTVTSPEADPGNAGNAALLRAAGFRRLAEAAAAEGVAWLTLGQ
jgi:hypothetical protein